MARRKTAMEERSAFQRDGLRRFIDPKGPAPVEEANFVIPHERIVWRDAKGHFVKAPVGGRSPKGWHKQKIVQYTDTLGKPAKKPEDLGLVSQRWIQYKEPYQKGTRSQWKNADKVDFRKPLLARIVEQKGERKQPVEVVVLNEGNPKLWRKFDRSENRKFLVPEIFVGKKIEIQLEGPTVRDALAKFNWEVAGYGERVLINSKVLYYYRDTDGDLIQDRFNVDLVEEWYSAPNILAEDASVRETYGSILRNRYGEAIRKGFANNRARFTTLDTLQDLYDSGMFTDEEEFGELYALMEVRSQAEQVKIVLTISVEDTSKLRAKKKAAKKSKRKPN